MRRAQRVIVWLGVWVLVPGVAQATNGHFPHGYGTKNKAMGGAGAALPQDSMASATNPAGLAFVGSRVDGGTEIMAPPVRYRIEGNALGLDGVGNSEADIFVIPHLGANWRVKDRTALGLSLYGNGLVTDYPMAIFGSLGSHGRTGLSLNQVILNTTLATRVTEQASVGISWLTSYQRFKARGLQAFGALSSDTNRLTDRGGDSTWGTGLRIGGLIRFCDDRLAAAVSWQPKMGMRKMDKYAGLIAQHGDIDTPAVFTTGLAVKVTPQITLVGDYARIRYSSVEEFANPLSNTLQGTDLFGSDNGAGFGWNDIDVYKWGVQYEPDGTWVWRMGWNYGENPVETSEIAFAILAPAVSQHHLTAGFTRKLGASGELNVAYTHAFSNSETGPVPDAFGGGSAKVSMVQDSIEVSYGWAF
jgi:long-chain fatty acid transport protein